MVLWNWRIEMAIVKSNLCPTCGGLLSIDLDKQIYVCPFCGVSFDYEYFREDNVKDVASKAIGRSEFGSAKDAYDFMLTKDPHDFEALRGLFLCANKWKTMHPMLKDSDIHVSVDEPTLIYAIDNCLPVHKGYFEKIREALKELYHYRDLKKEAKNIDSEKDSAVKAFEQLQQEYRDNSRGFTNMMDEIWELEPKEREAFISVAGIIILLLIVLAVQSRAWPFFIVMGVFIVLAIIGYNIKKVVVAKRLRAIMVPAKAKIEELSDKHKAKSAEAEQSHWRYKKLVEEFMDMDPLPQKAPEKNPDNKTEK